MELECKEIVVCKINGYEIRKIPDPILNLVFHSIQKQLQNCRCCPMYTKCRVVRLLTGAVLAKRAMTLWKKLDDAYVEALRVCNPATKKSHLISAWETMYTFVRK